MVSFMILAANVVTLLVLSSLSGGLLAGDPRLFVEATSSGSLLVATGPGSSINGGIGSGSESFLATSDCTPGPYPFPEGCMFDFSTLQGSGALSVVWESDGTRYSLSGQILISSVPNPENRTSGAIDSSDTFAIWDLSFDAVLSAGSSAWAFTARGFIWALIPPFATQCCFFESRTTAILLGEPIAVSPGTELPFLGFFLIWLSESQILPPNNIDVPAADSVHHLVTTQLAFPVEIDIKPSSFPNSINPKNLGKIAVAILSSTDFNASGQVDASSLTFGRTGNEQSLAFCNGSEDINNDGLLDLVCHFDTQASGFQQGDTVGILRGRTIDGSSLEGEDSIRVV